MDWADGMCAGSGPSGNTHGAQQRACQARTQTLPASRSCCSRWLTWISRTAQKPATTNTARDPCCILMTLPCTSSDPPPPPPPPPPRGGGWVSPLLCPMSSVSKLESVCKSFLSSNSWGLSTLERLNSPISKATFIFLIRRYDRTMSNVDCISKMVRRLSEFSLSCNSICGVRTGLLSASPPTFNYPRDTCTPGATLSASPKAWGLSLCDT